MFHLQPNRNFRNLLVNGKRPKPYSFESMRNSSESEKDDIHESQDERRRGNKS